ncbi:MAG: class I mannose-6-phosphate isomerase [Clostridium sp.]|nr:class I mannose-6-phosphate isomerase [Clostridium sp.]
MESSDSPVGESWEVSCVPSSTSIISNGELKGKYLSEIIKKYPHEILGEKVAKKYDNELPLLVKFIDAERDLSIQVHPDDIMAQREHGKMGKSEMWYIIDAKPGAFLYAGFKEKLTPEEYARKVAEGTICESLAKHEVHKGDVFYLPAGRVHAICGGILLAEVQQSSDVTYRIFDYNRPGMDGKPRKLHTELAAKALDFEVLDEYRTIYDDDTHRANHCIDSPYFNVRVVDIEAPFHRNLLKYDSFIITMCLKGDCKIKMRMTSAAESEIILNEGHSCLIPASIADYDVIPLNGKTLLLDAFIDNKDRSLLSMATRFLHITDK